MFILAIIGILVLIYFIFHFVMLASQDLQSGYKKNTQKYYVHVDDVDISDLNNIEQNVYNYLKNNGPRSELDITIIMKISKGKIKNLVSEGYLKEYVKNKEISNELVKLIVQFVIIILSMIAANYYLLIKLNLRYFGIILYIFIFLLFAYNLYAVLKGHTSDTKVKINSFSLFGIILFFFIFMIFGGRPWLHAEAYSNLIEVSEADFIEDIQTVDYETLPLVDKAYGRKLGSLKLGEYPGIGSEFEAGEYSDIIYQGQQYLVAPLEYRGFFKWLSNRSVGTPGYILINKITAKTELVNLREENGTGLIYTPSALFNQDLFRHAYYEGLNRYRLENQFFEIDEEGNPYYVLQYSLPTIFINGGNKINRIAVVNAVTGETNVYLPGEEPAWVESVYPNSIIFEQLDYWGSLQDGWLNSIFAQRGVVQPSDGTRVIMNEGELYYFTGLTSAGNDESTIGFVYSGMKTKETRLFRFAGATEEAAMNKVLTLLPQNNISTSFPIPMNVEDVPTYFILIKGEDGRILRFVYISVQDLELNSMSESREAAYNNYLVKLSEVGDSTTSSVTGTITEITSYVVEGNTIYWVELDNDLRYKINVSNFTDEELMYFIGLDVGDDITFNVLNFIVVSIDIE